MKKLLLTSIVIYAVSSFLYYNVLEGFTRFLIIPIGFSMLSFAGFLIKTYMLSDVRNFTNKQRIEKSKMDRIKKEEEKLEFFKNYDTEIRPLYNKGRILFSTLMKNGKMRKYQVKEFKKLIDGYLGCYIDYYHNYRFKNDAHEVYVKMKNFNLNAYDWERIISYLEEIDNNPSPEKINKNPLIN